MNQHKYLRAYMAGIVVPTIVIVLSVTAFCIARYAYDFSEPLERVMIFPMAVVPNLWGLWNMLWLASHARAHLAVGVHGALLPFLLLPIGATVARCFGVLTFGPTSATWFNACSVPYALIAVGFAAAVAAYYLVWKYIVGFLNRTLGIA